MFKFYAILDGQYRKSSDINTVTVDIGLYFWIVFLDCIFGEAVGRAKNTVQKYNPKIQFNIEKYRTRRSRVRYFAISNEEIIPSEISHTSRGPVKAACGPGPRDVWDISRGMISEFDIAR